MTFSAKLLIFILSIGAFTLIYTIDATKIHSDLVPFAYMLRLVGVVIMMICGLFVKEELLIAWKRPSRKRKHK